jgi:hypothetical protein
LKSDTAIRKEILDYLAVNPTAQDTLEGIVEWWLLEQQIEKAASAVKTALTRLVNEKKVTVIKGADGRVHYRLSRVNSVRSVVIAPGIFAQGGDQSN